MAFTFTIYISIMIPYANKTVNVEPPPKKKSTRERRNEHEKPLLSGQQCNTKKKCRKVVTSIKMGSIYNEQY
jgi:hypothetical protein